MSEIGTLEISWIQGFTRDNVEFVDNNTVCYACGNHICFLNLETKTRNVFPSPGRSVGALTTDCRSGTFAFSERKLDPSIFVHTFPELELKNELKGNTPLDYTSLTLSDGGPYLGSCSSFPDYSITVWNWEKAELLCTQSQGGRDVIYLEFNPLNCLQLCALGTTTLTFWNIERCGSFHLLKPSAVQLPEIPVSSSEKPTPTFTKDPNCISQILAALSEHKEAPVTPSTICWTATSQLCVGCAEGYLLLVDPESLSVSILVDPKAANAIPELKSFYFQATALYGNGLIAVGKESVMHCLQSEKNQVSIRQTWQLERPVTTAVVSPNKDALLLSANTGQIYVLNTGKSDQIEKILDVHNSSFVTAALFSDKNICVSLRDSGILQLWSSGGTCLASLPLETEVLNITCCPIAHYAAVGTASGKILFIDLNFEKQLRLVHKIDLYHTAVDHLVFDQEGCYLLCSGLDSHLYVLDGRPSAKFKVLGYVEVPGRILSLSTQCHARGEDVKALALCGSQEDKKNEGSWLLMFCLPFKGIGGSFSVDRQGCLHIPKIFKFKVPAPLTSCVLGIGEAFGYCHRSKSLQRFQFSEDTFSIFSKKKVTLNPKDEVNFQLPGCATLLLSPDCMLLASMGRQGVLQLRSTSSMELCCQRRCHSKRLGGIRSVSFSPDSLKVVTTGVGDGSLLCTDIRADDEYMAAYKKRQIRAQSIRTSFISENPILINLPVQEEETSVSSKKTEETEFGLDATDALQFGLDATEEDEHYLPPASTSTWLEKRHEEIVKEDNKEHAETKKELRDTMNELREAVHKMMLENENLPIKQFNLDVEEQKRLDAMAEEEAQKVKAEIEQDILEKQFQRDVLKRECWDSMLVKPRSINAFHSKLAVQNYPLKERREKELEDISRVQNMRAIEKAASKLMGRKKDSSKPEEGHVAESADNEKLSVLLAYANKYLYDQFSMQTVEQRVNQIILIQDLIYSIKMAFNSDFDALFKRKLKEIKIVEDRNKNIRDIMLELHIEEELWEPRLTDMEWPERLLIVEDSEIKAEKYLTPEQKAEEERLRLEREARLAAHKDDSRERALKDMMDGVLEVKKVDILKVEIFPPEFSLTKPPIQWSEEEKKLFKEYEKNFKELTEEKEKYKRGLEFEMKKLQEIIKESTDKFDESLIKLFEKKVKFMAAIYQEELKITYLAQSVRKVEEMNRQEQELKLKLEQLLAQKVTTEKDLMGYKDMVEQFQFEYEDFVAEDKNLDSEFRKEFADLPKYVTDQLYKLFKRRPRIQRRGTQSVDDSNVFRQHGLNTPAPDGLSQILAGMEEMDAPENMPKGVTQSVWEKFCAVRKTKVESEQKIKVNGLELAEMQAFLQRRLDEDYAAQEEIKQHFEELRSLRNKRNQHLMNPMILVVLPQGQVETSSVDLTAETAETDYILINRSVVDNLKEKIRKVAEQKITYMEARCEVRKDIIQLEWQHRVLDKKIEDLHEQKRDIKMLRLSKDDMECLSKKDPNTHVLEKISKMEKSIDFMKRTHKRAIHRRMKKLKQLNKKISMTADSSTAIKKNLPEMETSVAELRHIYEAAATEENEAAERDERYQEILHRRQLEDLARAKSDELDLLRKEVERLERRNFPSLDQLKHN
ncbi:cilia- and flagella-associated protein 43 isoform X2 [Poecilia reticulata]|uniref:cilia- and flagella-associated protein 43 isoform X2 n=1 Tax=Poecilia reticulata TaxID=8081 RepID=UPI0004A478E3|nr:PREDICTED: cilia- and flagella-associated protein 43 isoform X2 [Poecilia reticulata]